MDTYGKEIMVKKPEQLAEGQQVGLVIGRETPLGYRAIINQAFEGVLYKNELFEVLKQGQEVKGFIKKIREDGKIDLSLYKPGAKAADDLSKRILNVLTERGGRLEISDKSSPEKIYKLFNVSKKRYKNAIGALYKKRMITIEKRGITLIRETGERPPEDLNKGVKRFARRRKIGK